MFLAPVHNDTWTISEVITLHFMILSYQVINLLIIHLFTKGLFFRFLDSSLIANYVSALLN